MARSWSGSRVARLFTLAPGFVRALSAVAQSLRRPSRLVRLSPSILSQLRGTNGMRTAPACKAALSVYSQATLDQTRSETLMDWTTRARHDTARERDREAEEANKGRRKRSRGPPLRTSERVEIAQRRRRAACDRGSGTARASVSGGERDAND